MVLGFRHQLPPGAYSRDYRAPVGGSLRIARGGSWLYGAKASRSANRDSYGETTRCSDLGFRVVLAPRDMERHGEQDGILHGFFGSEGDSATSRCSVISKN
jgi:hypothetical protein